MKYWQDINNQVKAKGFIAMILFGVVLSLVFILAILLSDI